MYYNIYEKKSNLWSNICHASTGQMKIDPALEVLGLFEPDGFEAKDRDVIIKKHNLVVESAGYGIAFVKVGDRELKLEGDVDFQG